MTLRRIFNSRHHAPHREKRALLLPNTHQPQLPNNVILSLAWAQRMEQRRICCYPWLFLVLLLPLVTLSLVLRRGQPPGTRQPARAMRAAGVRSYPFFPSVKCRHVPWPLARLIRREQGMRLAFASSAHLSKHREPHEPLQVAHPPLEVRSSIL
jgi:hypothetical protein